MKKSLAKLIRWGGLSLLLVGIAFFGFVWFGTYHPANIEPTTVTCPESAPTTQAGQSLKVLTWNVQTMSGKNYVFWNDLPNGDGPDERPSPEDITLTLSEVARIIKDENPDIILLEEIDNGAARTDYEDQFARLKELLPSDYVCSTSAYYWKAVYVPHPRIHGRVGWTMVILSKYQIGAAERLQLALPPNNWLMQQFSPKRAILEAHLPIAQGGEFVVMATHLDVVPQGTTTKEIQVGQINDLLTSLTGAGVPWVIGGDFNLLPFDDAAYQRLSIAEQSSYNPHSEIKLLYDSYQAVPSADEVTGANFAQWFTFFPNDPAIADPDRTLDYLFLSSTIKIGEHYVRQTDTQDISDHFPVIAVIQLP
jgi:endonuclease/exonuclease/phosphatase family metal-dependent hydrolase